MNDTLRQTLRGLARNPGLAVTAIVTLALGTGVLSALFALVNAVLLRPLPVPRPDGLVTLHGTHDDGFGGFSAPDYRELRERNDALVGLAAFAGRFPSVRVEGGEARQLAAQAVSGDYFSVLEVGALFGRLFSPEDEARAQPVAVVSHRFAERELSGAAGAVGRVLHVNGRPLTVVGVLPPGFQGTFVGFRFDLFVPYTVAASAEPGDVLSDPTAGWLELIGRLAPGVSVAAGQERLDRLARALSRGRERKERYGITAVVTTPIDRELRPVITRLLLLLLGVGAVVLAIAGANVGSLLRARAAGRRRELAVRHALGASRGRLAAHLLTESLVLYGAGGALGLLLSTWLSGALLSFAPRLGSVRLEFDLAPDARALAFALATTLLASLLFGLGPALSGSRVELLPALKAGQGLPRRGGLAVAAQIALAMLLLVTAGLFTRTLDRMAATSPGFEPEGLQMATVNAALFAREPEAVRRFFDELLLRARALPGVESAALTSRVPLGFGGATVEIGPDEPLLVERTTVSPGAFQTLLIPLVAGRDLLETDRHAVVVDETLARLRWGGAAEALGRTVTLEGRPREVVGVAGAVRMRSLGQAPRPAVYLPFAETSPARVTVLLRAAGGPALISAFRGAARGLAPDVPVVDAMPVTEYIGVASLPQRMTRAVTTAVGLLGLVLAAVGLHGLVAYTVARRTRELGIRLSLGASPAGLVRMVLSQAAMLWAGGAVAGSLLAAGLALLLRGMLFGVGALDAASYVTAAFALGLVTLAASALPAARAARLSPSLALRGDA